MPASRERMAMTVGHLVRNTLEQKGHRPFVRAAAELPDVRFVFVGKWHDDAIEVLRELAGDNVEFTGWVSDEELHDLYRRASVYVQASRHEGFGLAVAEAMLAGCVPVVMNVTAMPEVVGDAGVLIESQEPEAVAAGVQGGARARARGARCAPASASSRPSRWSKRRDALLTVVEEALHRRQPSIP